MTPEIRKMKNQKKENLIQKRKLIPATMKKRKRNNLKRKVDIYLLMKVAIPAKNNQKKRKSDPKKKIDSSDDENGKKKQLEMKGGYLSLDESSNSSEEQPKKRKSETKKKIDIRDKDVEISKTKKKNEKNEGNLSISRKEMSKKRKSEESGGSDDEIRRKKKKKNEKDEDEGILSVSRKEMSKKRKSEETSGSDDEIKRKKKKSKKGEEKFEEKEFSTPNTPDNVSNFNWLSNGNKGKIHYFKCQFIKSSQCKATMNNSSKEEGKKTYSHQRNCSQPLTTGARTTQNDKRRTTNCSSNSIE